MSGRAFPADHRGQHGPWRARARAIRHHSVAILPHYACAKAYLGTVLVQLSSLARFLQSATDNMDKLTRSADSQEHNDDDTTLLELDPIDDEDGALFREIDLNLAPHA